MDRGYIDDHLVDALVFFFQINRFVTQTYLNVESETSVFIRLHFDQDEVVVWNCSILYGKDVKNVRN